MIQRFSYWLACAAVLAAAQSFAPAVQAQAVPRVKAKLLSLDGDVMTLQPLATQNATTAAPQTVTLTAETRYVLSEKSGFAAIKPGDYAGAAVEEGRGGWLKATDVYVYAEALRGTGEGRFPDNGRVLVNGTVTSVQSTTPQNMNDGTLTLHYRGATLTPMGRGRAVCEGRAVPAPFASALACSADAAIQVSPGTPISTLTVGDRALLQPGAIVSVAVAKGPGDRNIAPGVVIEKPAVEKPQSAP